MFEAMTVIRALADENRVRIVMALRDNELCVCQLTGLLDLSPSTTSKHLSILRQARLIDSKKRGKWVYYSLALRSAPTEFVRDTLAWVTRNLANAPAVLDDELRIVSILAAKEEYCALQEKNNLPDAFHSLEIHTLAAADE